MDEAAREQAKIDYRDKASRQNKRWELLVIAMRVLFWDTVHACAKGCRTELERSQDWDVISMAKDYSRYWNCSEQCAKREDPR